MVNKKIISVLNRYKIVGKPYKYPKCELCGGRLVKDGEWVCNNCGLVQGPILLSDYSSSRWTESKTHKKNREIIWNKKIHKLLRMRDYQRDYMRQYRKDRTPIYIDKKLRPIIKKYCESESITMYTFANVIIKLALKQLQEEVK